MGAITHFASGPMGSNASLTISSIPQTAKDLILLVRASVNTTVDELAVRPNGTASGYSYRYIRNSLSTQGTTGSLTGGAGTSEIYYRGGYLAGTTAGEPYMSAHEYHIPNYTGSSYHKIMTYIGGIPRYSVEIRGHLLQNTAAITSITLGPVSGNVFNHGSTYHLYGVG